MLLLVGNCQVRTVYGKAIKPARLGNIWYANGMTYIVVFMQKFAVKILPSLSK
jgi:hypothetical protein